VTALLTRARLLRLALAGAAAVVAGPAAAGRSLMPSLRRLSVRNRGRAFAGDRSFFATVSPGVRGRDTAAVSFSLDRAARVRLEAVRTALRNSTVVWTTENPLPPGEHSLKWQPLPETPVGSYVMRLTVESAQGRRKVYGGKRPSRPELATAPVVRVLGVEASFDRRSYMPGETAKLTIAADAASLSIQVLACGTEDGYTDRADEMRGLPVGDPITIDWRSSRLGPRAVPFPVGQLASGVYGLRILTEDERVGYTPLIVRPATLGTARQAIVVPTNTWQAYNYYDVDGDGWGDTWYAGGSPPVRLDRPFRDRGTPLRWRRYDVGYLKWLRWTERFPDYLSEDDLEAVPSGDDLRKLYDLVVFPAHTEYVTEQAYNVVQRFRDLGGRLIFLSANNFFWKVEKRGNAIRRVKLWRELGRPEAALCGVQYKANDDGTKQGPFYVVRAADAPWLWEGTGLTDGSKLGDTVGGYGIEIDGTTAASPPETKVLAMVPNLFGTGLHAEMAYYETAAGARVFSAGALDFGGSVNLWPMRRMLENLWRHMTEA
jgi:N,N-dimethylformamidase beta subunit-like, C-terminal